MKGKGGRFGPTNCGEYVTFDTSDFYSTGLAILRSILDRDELMPVGDAAHAYMSDMQDHIARNDFNDIDPDLKFSRGSMSADLVAIDPATKNEPNAGQVARTLLFRIIMRSELGSLLAAVLGPHVTYDRARVRVVTPAGDGYQGPHMEKKGTNFPGTIVLWLPLSEGGNRDAPGLRVYTGQRELLKTVPHPPRDVYDAMNAGGPDVLCPNLSIGDAILFDKHIPHATFLPDGATKPRVNFDIRLYPTPEGLVPNFPVAQ